MRIDSNKSDVATHHTDNIDDDNSSNLAKSSVISNPSSSPPPPPPADSDDTVNDVGDGPPQQQQQRRRRVCFNPNLITNVDDDDKDDNGSLLEDGDDNPENNNNNRRLSLREKSKLWWTKDEMKQIQENIYFEFARLLDISKRNKSKWVDEEDSDNDDDGSNKSPEEVVEVTTWAFVNGRKRTVRFDPRDDIHEVEAPDPEDFSILFYGVHELQSMMDDMRMEEREANERRRALERNNATRGLSSTD